jgi:sugar transferase (PEP-CTERM/EpsH1 system associated)
MDLEKTVHRYRERLQIRPGITGLAQVQLPPDSDLDSVRLKLAYDLYYLENQTWWLDFRILCSTALVVLKAPFTLCEVLFALPSRECIQRLYTRTANSVPAVPAAPAMPSALPDVLYLVHRLPYPPDKGDRIRAFHLLRFLARRCNVHLACLADEPVPEQNIAMLRRYCAQLEIVPIGRWQRRWRAAGSLALGRSASEGAFANAALRSRVGAWAKATAFHAVLASSSSMAPYLRLPGLTHIPAVVDLVDLDSQKWFDYAASSRGVQRWFYQLEGTRLRQFERDIASWAHGLTLVSQAEADLYRRCCGDGPVQAVSNGVDLDYFAGSAPRPSASRVFVGALDYWPNVEGVCWFCKEVWPIIQRARPDACLELVGRQPVAAVKRLGDIAGVRVVGQVPDIRPFLTDAALVIAPLRIARGIQNKVLEAMAMARPTVASPQSLEGLNVVPGRHVICAGEREEWVSAIIDLLADPGARHQLGQAGRRFVEQHHSWDSCLAPLESILRLPSLGNPHGDAAEMLTAVRDEFACRT